MIGSLEPGGTERQLVELIRRSSAPDRHRIVVFQRPGALASTAPCTVEVVGPVRGGIDRCPSIVRSLAELRRAIRASPVDVVHAHLGLAQLLATAAVPRAVPVVASRRGRTPRLEDRAAGRAAVAAANRRTRLLLTNSDELAERARRERDAPPVRVIRNGVDLERFAPLPSPSGPPTVAVVARLRREKGHARFLRAFGTVRAQLPDVRAIVAGGGPMQGELTALAADLGLGDAVRFTGELADPRSVIAEAHVVALASPHEGFPNAVLEAMACGRPIVATAVGGVPELVRGGIDGLLVPDDDDAFAQGLVDLLRDGDARERMGLAARDRAHGFSWAAVVERTEAVYRELAGPRRRALMEATR